MYRVEEKKGAKFREESSVRADWLCISCPKFMGWRKAGNSNRGLLFCMGLYRCSLL